MVDNWQLPLFWVFDAFIIFFFLLKTFPQQQDLNTALVLSVGFLASGFALLWLRSLLKDRNLGMPFENNLDENGFKLTLGVAAVILVLLAFNARTFFSVLYVPRGSVLSGIPSGISDAIYNFMLVAPSEELLVLILMLGFVLLGIKKPSFGFMKDPYVAALIARLGWGLLHTVLAYGNDLQAVFIAVALGMAFTFVMFRTKSVLSAIILHGTWNAGTLLIPILLGMGTQ